MRSETKPRVITLVSLKEHRQSSRLHVIASSGTLPASHPYSCQEETVSGLLSPAFNILLYRLVSLWHTKR